MWYSYENLKIINIVDNWNLKNWHLQKEIEGF